MLSPVSTQTQTAEVSAAGSTTVSGLASDFETFLKMLTAQARYQDPLEPLDSSQYASQLAQFSMVEQQVQTNNMLATLSGSGGGTGALGGWLGMDVRIDAQVPFTGREVIIQGDPNPLADSHILVTRTANGEEVGRQALHDFSGSAAWNMTDAEGKKMPDGLYSFEIAAMLNGRELAREPAGSFHAVSEARISEGQVSLVLDDGRVVPTSSIVAARQSDT